MESLLEHFKQILIGSLSNIFTTVESSNNYKIITTIANEVDTVNQNADELRKAISLNQATSGDLDLHGFTMDLQRINNEEDEDYRQRLLDSYDRPYITKNNLINLSKEYSESIPRIEESIYNRFWIGGSSLPDSITETLSTTGSTLIASSGILNNTIPDCWLITDTTKSGTNYCSGCNILNNEINLAYTLPDNTQLNVEYIPNQATSGADIDWLPIGFINDEAIIRHRNLSNNYTEIESTATYIKIQTNMLKNYIVYSSYTDEEKGLIYSWKSIVDENGQITLDENTRTDSLITNEFQVAKSKSLVSTSFDIAKVDGVFLANDIDKLGTNYSTDNNFNGKNIYLNTELNNVSGVIVTYNKNPIKNYTNLFSNLFVKSGEEDLRFTIEVQITQPFLKYNTFKYNEARWGQLENELTGTLGQLIDTAKAAGIKSSVILVTKGTYYGAEDAIYAQAWYGGSYY